MAAPLKFNPSTQPGESATGSRRTCCDGSLGPGSRRIFPLRDEAIAVEAPSFAREHARLGGIDFGQDQSARR
jgi:hypothetical protein